MKALAPISLEKRVVVFPQYGLTITIEAQRPKPPPKKKRAPKGTFDRTKYQRDLMRKRRKEGKA
jgi:hypothetical protein